MTNHSVRDLMADLDAHDQQRQAKIAAIERAQLPALKEAATELAKIKPATLEKLLALSNDLTDTRQYALHAVISQVQAAQQTVSVEIERIEHAGQAQGEVA